MGSPPRPSTDKPYPADWEEVAELRVFRAPEDDWIKLVTWRADMHKRGWRLLKVNSDTGEVVAVFGRTKTERSGPPRSD